MKERPILFNASMVRAILEGRKTQTRRVVKDPRGLYAHLGQKTVHPAVDSIVHVGDGEFAQCAKSDVVKQQYITTFPFHRLRCPYGQPGDRLWVRESFRIGEDLGAGWEPLMACPNDRFVIYDATGTEAYGVVPDDYGSPRNAQEIHNSEGTDEHWRSFGPIPSIHMPRWASRITLEITDVRVERLQDISLADAIAEGLDWVGDGGTPYGVKGLAHSWNRDPRKSYRALWESINGAGLWDANPWVWVVAFKTRDPLRQLSEDAE